MPRNKIQQIFKDLYAVSLIEGTLQNQQQSAYEALAEDEKHIKSCLGQSQVVHFDETGVYVGRQRLWAKEFHAFLLDLYQRSDKVHNSAPPGLPNPIARRLRFVLKKTGTPRRAKKWPTHQIM